MYAVKMWSKVKRIDKETHPDQISTVWFFVLLICAISLFCLSLLKFNSLPTPNLSENYHEKVFNTRQARQYLTSLGNFGPKVAGSVENEVSALNYLLEEIYLINQQKNDAHEIDISVQKADGFVYLEYSVNSMGSAYQAVQNIVVRLRNKNVPDPKYNILINSHYDTVAMSPGGGDAGTMISVMMETLRVLSLNEDPFEHGIIFLFNGCEENALQGSHAFITQHYWAPSVSVVLNLDAAGNGGREILFQTTPGYSWLLNYYRKYAPHPYTSAMGEELFQAELIPSDTDFRIFRDYGNVPGMDFAFNRNGYVYHTKHDTSHIVPDGTLQHTGDNLLALTKALANAEEFKNSETESDEQVVFFDFMNLGMLYYTQSQAMVINYIVVVAALVCMGISIYIEFKNDPYPQKLMNHGIMFLIQFTSLIVGIAVVIAFFSWFYNAIGFPMRWFNHNYLIFGLYMCPLFFLMTFLPAKSQRLKPMESVEAQMYLMCFLMVLVLIVVTSIGIRTAFMFMVPVFFYTLSLLVQIPMKIYGFDRKWKLLIHIVFQLVPFAFYSTWTVIAFDTFIPLSGRSGIEGNPELMIAVFSNGMGILLAAFLLPMTPIFRSPKCASLTFLVIWALSFILMLTPAGFPYADKIAPQRQSVYHMLSRSYNVDGSVRNEKSGFMIRGADANNMLPFNYMKEDYKYSNYEDSCYDDFLCGFPLLYNTDMTSNTILIPSDAPEIPYTESELVLLQKEDIEDGYIRHNFSLKCPNNCGLYIEAPTLLQWSFTNTSIPSESIQFISYYNVEVEEPRPQLDFWLDVDSQRPDITIGVAAHYTAHLNAFSPEFQKFLDEFPSWTAINNWISTFYIYRY